MSDVKNCELAEADYMAGMKYKDIAEKYDISINTVKSWKKRYGWCREKGAHKNAKKGAHKKEQKIEKEEPVVEEVEEVLENSELTDKQRLFCVLYTRCFNATKAYQKAYRCTYNTAASNGYKLLRNAQIKAEIENLKQNRLNREMIKEEDIVQMYIDILYTDITDYVNPKLNMIDLNNPLADGRLIKKVSFGKTDSIELLDKMKALQWLSDHMDLATEKQKAEIAALRAKVDTESEESKQKQQQAQDNMSEILKQIQKISDDDVCE